MFVTRSSVGFTRGSFKEDDDIFAVDGARAPLILRRRLAQSYKLVSECYLWVPLGLDCWNPGMKEGRWGPDVPRPNNQRARIIEIH